MLPRLSYFFKEILVYPKSLASNFGQFLTIEYDTSRLEKQQKPT